MTKDHIKRIAAEQTWNIKRKSNVFVTRALPGSYNHFFGQFWNRIPIVGMVDNPVKKIPAVAGRKICPGFFIKFFDQEIEDLFIIFNTVGFADPLKNQFILRKLWVADLNFIPDPP